MSNRFSEEDRNTAMSSRMGTNYNLSEKDKARFTQELNLDKIEEELKSNK